MPQVAPAEVRDTLTAFASETDEAVNAAIEVARSIHDIRKMAVIYLAGHVLALSSEHTGSPDGGSGAVASERIGPRQVNYRTMSKDGDALRVWCETTSYGRTFLALAATSPRSSIGARVAA